MLDIYQKKSSINDFFKDLMKFDKDYSLYD